MEVRAKQWEIEITEPKLPKLKSMLDNAYKLDGENIKEYYTEYGALHFVPLNQKSIRL